jgi:pyruvate,water dikinase
VFGRSVHAIDSALKTNRVPAEPISGDRVVIVGQSASPGRARGRVRIVLSGEQSEAMELGDVLVTSMTNPDLVLAMEKASAIVTDEGGITCHAAITARELGVPCVIGTGNATKLLPDGAFVNVDADTGTVEVS